MFISLVSDLPIQKLFYNSNNSSRYPSCSHSSNNNITTLKYLVEYRNKLSFDLFSENVCLLLHRFFSYIHIICASLLRIGILIHFFFFFIILSLNYNIYVLLICYSLPCSFSLYYKTLT